MVESCLKECERLIQSGSSTFYKAFGMLDRPRRDAVFVIYAFCRIIDNSVDEPESSPYSLDELEFRFRSLDTAEGHFIWPALRWLFRHFPQLPKKPFFLQMQGQRMDLQQTRYNTFEQLDHYCYLVAGTVGEMLVPVLHDDPNEQVLEEAVLLGKAMQLVNIIRDVGEDAARGRRYLPKELMDRYGYGPTDFERRRVNKAFRHLIEDLAQQAHLWMDQGLEHVRSYPDKSAFAVELAARGYEAILEAVRENDYQVFARRAVVSSLRKLGLWITLQQKYYISNSQPKKGAVI